MATEHNQVEIKIKIEVTKKNEKSHYASDRDTIISEERTKKLSTATLREARELLLGLNRDMLDQSINEIHNQMMKEKISETDKEEVAAQ